MRFPEHSIENLRGLGYTEDEARFLYLVATHSGYFATRQFLNLTGAKSGDRSIALTQRVLGKGHANARLLLRNGRVYHLFSRVVYRAIGRQNLRNRREHGLEHIRSRLVILDFILAHLDYEYVETEQDKLRYFLSQMNVPKEQLPTKTYRGAISRDATERYFVDKFPMFFRPHAGTPPVVSFTFIDPGYATLNNFDSHLLTYAGLFRTLPNLNLVYVATRPRHFEAARQMFLSRVDRPLNIDPGEEVLDYFRIRKYWETKQYDKFTNEDVLRLHGYVHKFASQRYQERYPAWRDGQVSDAMISSYFRDLAPKRKVAFESELVDGQAALFESKPHRQRVGFDSQPLNVRDTHHFSEVFSSPFERGPGKAQPD